MTISINLKGRLGNQLFQYATLRSLSIKKGYDFFINTSLKWHGQDNLLDYFNIVNSNPSFIFRCNHYYTQPGNGYYFDKNIYNINDNTLLDGHFENLKYFDEHREIIMNELTIKDETINNYTNNYIKDILNDGSKLVGIHFRRGDLIQQITNVEEFNIEIKKFVEESLETIMKTEKNITLLLFTGGIRKEGSCETWVQHTHDDDIIWVNQLIRDYKCKFNVHLSPGTKENNELIDYNLLSNCDYMIIPHHSSFSYMAYYTNKKVIELFSKNIPCGIKEK
jgi:ribosomal protein L32